MGRIVGVKADMTTNRDDSDLNRHNRQDNLFCTPIECEEHTGRVIQVDDTTMVVRPESGRDVVIWWRGTAHGYVHCETCSCYERVYLGEVGADIPVGTNVRVWATSTIESVLVGYQILYLGFSGDIVADYAIQLVK